MQIGSRALALGIVAMTAWGCSGTGDEPSTARSNRASTNATVPGGVAPGSGPNLHLVPFPSTGDLWVLDGETTNVLRIDPAGTVTIGIAVEEIKRVTGLETVDFDDCGMAFDASGVLYFVEAESDSVLRREPNGRLTMLVSGDAIRSLTGDETPDPEGLAVGFDGRVYFLEDNTGMILAADPVSGALSTFADAATIAAQTGITDIDLGSNLLAGPEGVLYVATRGKPSGFLEIGPGPIARVLVTSAALGPIDGYMTRDPSGEIIVVDDLRDMVRRLSLEGNLSNFLTQVRLEEFFKGEIRFVSGIAFDSSGNFYLLDDNSESIARFDSNLVGTVWVDEQAVTEVTGSGPDYSAGIAFAPR